MVSEGNCGILVMLDLSAAFDTVVHEYLLSDLKFIGIDGSAYTDGLKAIYKTEKSHWLFHRGNLKQGN